MDASSLPRPPAARVGAPAMTALEASAVFARVAGNIEKVMRGSRDRVRKLLAAYASGGHVQIGRASCRERV